MQITEFLTVIKTFADPGAEILYDKSRIVISVNDIVISAEVLSKSGDIYINENDTTTAASEWIVNRIARLPLLAARILDWVPSTYCFVSPSASLLPTLEQDQTDESEHTPDALKSIIETIDRRSPLETTVLYVTSDAGEGKTSLINELARTQAERYHKRLSDWLLVPIPLGGRNFLRFDDITAGVLQNRYRYSALYYDSFLALVKMGVIVPAYDGFEEMFVENSSGEALSAMGSLVGSLVSQGTIVVSARKAYFDFENLKNQERLFDSIRHLNVGFGKLELDRWSHDQFIDYGQKRDVNDIEGIYARVCERLKADHPLLTRAVLVSKLLDIASSSSSLNDLLEKINQPCHDYFKVFVRGLIEREATEKWIDRSGADQIGCPLLSIDEHCELLSLLATTMWDSHVDYIKQDDIELLVDLFSETKRKNATQAAQIRKRILGHALLISSPNVPKAVEFDHDEFKCYFLGEGIANQILTIDQKAKPNILNYLRTGRLPQQALRALVNAINRCDNCQRCQITKYVIEISDMNNQASYVHQNFSDIIISLLSHLVCDNIVIRNMAFDNESMRDKKLEGITFEQCYFGPTSLELSEFTACEFLECEFTQMRIAPTTAFNDVSFVRCSVDSLTINNTEVWDPNQIDLALFNLGISYGSDHADTTCVQMIEKVDMDVGLLGTTKIVRYMMRSTHIGESIILKKIGDQGQEFIDDYLPMLVSAGIIERIQDKGAGVQKRYRLNVPLGMVNEAIIKSNGSFNQFVAHFDMET